MDKYIEAIIVSLIAAFAFHVFLSRSADSIRAWFVKTKSSFLRAIYVSTLISAIRGRASVSDTRSISLLPIFAVAIGVILNALLYKELLETKAILDAAITSYERHERLSAAKKDIDSELTALKSELTAMKDMRREQYEEHLIFAENYEFKLSVTLYIELAALFVGVSLCLFWLPFTVIRRGMAFEFERLTSRLQILASKNELASLCRAELSVNDEASLKQFFTIIQEIASRHEIDDVVKRFLIL